MRKLICVLATLALVGCSERQSVGAAVERFFELVNEDRRETLKTESLAAPLAAALDSALAAGVARSKLEAELSEFVREVDDVEIGDVTISGEQATATALVTLKTGARRTGQLQLVKEGGATWRVIDWGRFTTLGERELLLAAQSCDTGDLAAADRWYAEAAALSPDDMGILADQADCHFRRGDGEVAERLSRAVIRRSSGGALRSYLLLAEIQRQRDQHDASVTTLEEAIRVNPGRPDAYEALMRGHIQRHDDAAALGVADRAQASKVRSDLLDGYRGWLYCRQGDFSRGVTMLRAAVEASPGDALLGRLYARVATPPDQRLRNAARRVDNRDFDGALAEVAAVLEVLPTHAGAVEAQGRIRAQAVSHFSARSEAALAAAKYDEAIELARRVLEHDPANAGARRTEQKAHEIKRVLGYR